MSTAAFMLLLAVSSALIAWALTAALRRYAIHTRLLDHPNERSSHTVPTPRGGGLGFVAAFLTATAAWCVAGRMPTEVFAALLVAGLLIAVLGFVDDRHPLPAGPRFAGHLAAAMIVMSQLAPLPKVPMFGVDVPLGLLGTAVACTYIVWSINLYNFMDGIDGIAGMQVLTVCLAGGALWWLATPGCDHAGVPVLMAACMAGFLVWNFPPAKIFMGDAGSGFLGLVIATLSLWSGTEQASLFWSWFILGGCFMVDATTTLIRRVRRGERFSQAHRSHAYQFAARIHGSHRPVTLAVALINVGWLMPWAAAVAFRLVDGLAATIVAFAPLVWLAFRYHAGDSASQSDAMTRPH